MEVSVSDEPPESFTKSVSFSLHQIYILQPTSELISLTQRLDSSVLVLILEEGIH